MLALLYVLFAVLAVITLCANRYGARAEARKRSMAAHPSNYRRPLATDTMVG